mgnify:CR=1 FL=1
MYSETFTIVKTQLFVITVVICCCSSSTVMPETLQHHCHQDEKIWGYQRSCRALSIISWARIWLWTCKFANKVNIVSGSGWCTGCTRMFVDGCIPRRLLFVFWLSVTTSTAVSQQCVVWTAAVIIVPRVKCAVQLWVETIYVNDVHCWVILTKGFEKLIGNVGLVNQRLCYWNSRSTVKLAVC